MEPAAEAPAFEPSPDALTPPELASRLDTDLQAGLKPAEAARRLARHGANELPRPRRRPLWRRLANQLREPMSLLLIAAAGVSGLALGERLDAAAIGAIVVLNAVIALVQEGRAVRALEALEGLQAPGARTRRGGSVIDVPARELVVGDVVELGAGDRVPADVRLVSGVGLQVDESMLTGESVPVDKHHDAPAATAEGLFDRPAMLFTGTLVTRGAGSGLVVATGSLSVLGQVASRLQQPAPTTPLQRELAGLSARLGTAAVAVAAGVFLLTLARTGLTAEWLERSFLSAVALAVAAVPEGLATVTLVALAVGVRRMAGERARATAAGGGDAGRRDGDPHRQDRHPHRESNALGGGRSSRRALGAVRGPARPGCGGCARGLRAVQRRAPGSAGRRSDGGGPA